MWCRYNALIFFLKYLLETPYSSPGSVVITRSNTTWNCIQYSSYWGRTQIGICFHNRHPISRPHGRAMGCIGCLLPVQSLIHLLRQSLHYCIHYRVMLDLVITAPIVRYYDGFCLQWFLFFSQKCIRSYITFAVSIQQYKYTWAVCMDTTGMYSLFATCKYSLQDPAYLWINSLEPEKTRDLY